MALNSRKHTIPSGADQSVSRGTIFESFGNSIHDIVPVENATERAQVVADLVAAGAGPSAANPLVTIRADAPGLHRVEYTYDGSVFLPASGVLTFADKAAATAWATANAALLTAGDEAIIGGLRVPWTGTEWAYWPWTPLTPASGWSAETSEGTRPEVCREGFQVKYRGRLYGGDANGSIATVLPAWAAPTRNLRVLFSVSSTGAPSSSSYGQVETGGNLRLWTWLGAASYTEWTVL